jgi:tRNA acetyltransferase TAN1
MTLLTHAQFAIRPTIRNHNTLARLTVIKQIASLVGQEHQVDLKNYDLLIVVEIYKVSIRYAF